jgi:hypothetical protein
MFDIEIMHRKGNIGNGSITHESYSVDFLIANQSLLKLLVDERGGHGDFLGCFARGWDNLNEHSFNQLLLISEPETENGRCPIYVCPECADIGCGSICCKISKDSDYYYWSDFAFENGYEEPSLIEKIGILKFEVAVYEATIIKAYAI